MIFWYHMWYVFPIAPFRAYLITIFKCLIWSFLRLLSHSSRAVVQFSQVPWRQNDVHQTKSFVHIKWEMAVMMMVLFFSFSPLFPPLFFLRYLKYQIIGSGLVYNCSAGILNSHYMYILWCSKTLALKITNSLHILTDSQTSQTSSTSQTYQVFRTWYFLT
jgi:hypothetical protein